MSSTAWPGGLLIHPRPSWSLAVLLALAHLGAALCIVSLPLSGWISGPAVVAILWNLARTLWRGVLGRGPYAVRALYWAPDGSWVVTDGSGDQRPAILDGEYFVSPFLTILNLKLHEGGGRSVVLLPDSIEPQRLRRLNARLRMSSVERSGS